MKYPAKTIEVSETIDLPFQAGGTLRGEGMAASVSNRKDHPLNGEGTRLVWTGEPGGTMVRVQGSYQAIQDLTLDGNGVAGVGILYEKTGRGLGTGKGVVEKVSIQGCTTAAIQIGTDEAMHNGDVLAFRDVYVQKCPIGIWCRNTMGMGHLIENFFGYGVPTLFAYDAGGFVQIKSTSVTYGVETVLRTGKHGRNNGMFSISDLKVDASMPTPLIIDQTQTASIAFSVRDLIVSSKKSEPRKGQPIFSLRPGGKLIIENGNGIHAGAVRNAGDHLGRTKIGGRPVRKPKVHAVFCDGAGIDASDETLDWTVS